MSEIKYVVVAKARYSKGYPDSDVTEVVELENVEIYNYVIIIEKLKEWLTSLGFKDPKSDYNYYFNCLPGSPSEGVTIDLYPCIKVMGSLYELKPFEIDNN